MTLVIAMLALTPATLKFEEIEYAGWRGCLKVSNGTAEIVIVPQIGRIMRYAFMDGKNVLFNDPDLLGQVAGAEYKNFGGDKVWPSPQSLWGWPPDSTFEQRPHTLRRSGESAVMISPVSQKHRIRFERTITLAKTGTRVEFRTRMVNAADVAQDYGIWQVTQTAAPDYAAMMVSPAAGFPFGWSVYDDKALPEGVGRLDGRPVQVPQAILSGAELQIRYPPDGGIKVGAPPNPFVLYAVWPGLRLTLFGSDERGGTFPDQGRARQIYAQRNKPYIELEAAGMVKRIPAGGQIRFDTAWELRRMGR